MQNIQPATANERSRPISPWALRLAIAFAATVLVTGCGDPTEGDTSTVGPSPKAVTAATASSVTVKKSLEDDPCALLTRETVSAAFGMAESELRQTKVSSRCGYSWKGNGRRLDVSLNIKVIGDDARSVATGFDNSTRSMTGAEVDNAFNKIAEQANKGQSTPDTPEKRQAAEMIAVGGKSSNAGGIQFEDVDGIADQARFEVSTGALNVHHGNMYFTLNAYAGDAAPTPSEFTPAAMQQASKDWMAATLPQRRQDTTKLAQAIIKQL